jgi:hypothetical protein
VAVSSERRCRVSEPTDLYVVRLERALVQAQLIIAAATQPYGLPADEALRRLATVLDDESLLRVMQHNGVFARYPDAAFLQVGS